MHLFRISFVTLAFFIAGCSVISLGVRNNLIKRLNGRGPVALSSTNPYIAPNLLLSEEMEKSEQIEAFIRHRGAPAAIEVYQELFSALYLYLYYPENAEMFTLIRESGEWTVEGPQSISKGVRTLVNQATKGIKGKPKVNFPTIDPPKPRRKPKKSTKKKPAPKKSTKKKVDLFDPASEAAKKQDPMIAELQEFGGEKLEKIGDAPKEKAPVIKDPVVATPTPQVTAPFTSTTTSTTQPTANQGVANQGKLSLDEIISREGLAPAELTPKGDLVHYVTYEGETLGLIALWYTKEQANAARLARMNKLNLSQKLELGDVVIIPTYLIKNTNRLTDSGLTKLQKLAR